MKHVFKTPADCDCTDEDREQGRCPVCDWELHWCKVCGLAEGSLTTDCPGERVSMEREETIRRGMVDYIDGPGWVVGPRRNEEG